MIKEALVQKLFGNTEPIKETRESSANQMKQNEKSDKHAVRFYRQAQGGGQLPSGSTNG